MKLITLLLIVSLSGLTKVWGQSPDLIVNKGDCVQTQKSVVVSPLRYRYYIKEVKENEMLNQQLLACKKDCGTHLSQKDVMIGLAFMLVLGVAIGQGGH